MQNYYTVFVPWLDSEMHIYYVSKLKSNEYFL